MIYEHAFSGSRIYALHDSDMRVQNKYGAFEISPKHIERYQEAGYGIFWCVNGFVGDKRLASQVSTLRYAFVDIDHSVGVEARAILSSPLTPSMVVQTKSGYHLYWKLHGRTTGLGLAQVEQWKRVVKHHLIPFYDADKKASDPLRLLRLPGTDHLKDPSHPELVRITWEEPVAYSLDDFVAAYPSHAPEVKARHPGGEAETFWEAVAQLDCAVALEDLSGHAAVKYEEYQLVPQLSGNMNIHVRRMTESTFKSTPCFVDTEGKLGNVTEGASIAAWLKWYGLSWGQAAAVLKDLYPELRNYK